MEENLHLADLPPEDGPKEVRIHPTALVAKGAELGVGVEVGPYCVVGPRVVLGDYVRLVSHVTVENRTLVGRRTAVWQFSALGVIPQDLKYNNEETELVIGPENSIRQYVNMSIGTSGGGARTVVGRRNLFMVNAHVAHDCVVGDNCVFANGVSLAGHVAVGDRVVVGGHAAVHQFCRLGERVMVGGGSMVVQDVPPYCMVQGDRAKPVGLNVVGLRRAGFTAEALRDLKNMYRLLYTEGLTVEDCIARIEQETADTDYRQKFVGFLKSSERGVCRP